MSVTTFHRLGRVEYADGLELQRRFAEARRAGTVGDSLMILHHPAVLTLGRGAKAGNVLASSQRLSDLGVEVHETDRGGDVTYHGPGQIVGYPLLFLPPSEQDVRKYVRRLEEVLIRTCAHFGIVAGREAKWPGVWTGGKKIAALGVHLSRWYTRHGFALNVEPDLSHFELIVPCGIREAGVTSMAAELNRSLCVDEVEPVVVEKFGEVFGHAMEPGPKPVETVAVVVRRAERTLTLRRTVERGGFWQVVTGRVEAGEAVAQAALREASEETGLRLSGLRSLAYQHGFAVDGPRLVREHGFAVEGAGDVVLSEHDQFEWLTRDEAIARMPFPGLKVAVARSYRA